MKQLTVDLTIKTPKRECFLDITQAIQKQIDASGLNEGQVILFVPHTTAAVTINENADPDVLRDLILGFEKAFPNRKEFAHLEGNSDAHLKSSMVGVDQTVLFMEKRLLLGTWQSVFFAEFDGPRTRKIFLRIIGD